MTTHRLLNGWPLYLLWLALLASPAIAQPTYEQDMARQRAEEQRIQNDWQQHAMYDGDDDVESESGGGDRALYSPPAPQYADSHMAVAWHFDTSEVWATSGHRTGDEAEKAVLTACNLAMNGGCMIGAQWVNNSFIAVAHDAAGIPYIRGGARFKSIAEAAAMEGCRKESFGCTLVRVVSETPIPRSAPGSLDFSRNDFPRGPVTRHSFALAAFPGKEPPDKWRGHAWLSTGATRWREERERLLAKCQADTGVPCVLGPTMPNGVLVRYIDDKAGKRWISAASAATAASRINSVCTQGSHCKVIETYSARPVRLAVIDEDLLPPPGRGFFALAWTSNWPKMAVVTGRKTDAEARAAALALCAAESKRRCELYLDKGDAGRGAYLAIYKDSAGNTRTYVGFSEGELEHRAETACAAAAVTCTKRGVFDLTRAFSATPAL